MSDEELANIPGYEGRYGVTKDGRVWSFAHTWEAGQGRMRHHAGFWLRPGKDSSGYPNVKLTLRGKSRMFKVHRLVASVWIPNPRGLVEINHLNGIKTDNRTENLEWCTHSENALHAWRTGLCRRTPAMDEHSRTAIRFAQIALRKVTRADADEIRRRVMAGERKSTVARSYGLTYWSVRDIVKGATYVD